MCSQSGVAVKQVSSTQRAKMYSSPCCSRSSSVSRSASSDFVTSNFRLELSDARCTSARRYSSGPLQRTEALVKAEDTNATLAAGPPEWREEGVSNSSVNALCFYCPPRNTGTDT